MRTILSGGGDTPLPSLAYAQLETPSGKHAGGDGGGRCGETGDALGWTGIEGQGFPTRRVLFTLREKGRRYVFRGDANEGVRRNMEKIRSRGCFGSARAH
jgi:hypothetical protein